MQKTLVLILALLCAGLVATNVFSFQAYLKANQKQADILKEWAGSAQQLRECQDTRVESLGEKAGLAMKDLQTKSGESYEALNLQAEKTAKQLEQITGEVVSIVQEQAAKTGRDLEASTSDLLLTLEKEIEKFRETLNKQ